MKKHIKTLIFYLKHKYYKNNKVSKQSNNSTKLEIKFVIM